jgi:hypothetical protein
MENRSKDQERFRGGRYTEPEKDALADEAN